MQYHEKWAGWSGGKFEGAKVGGVSRDVAGTVRLWHIWPNTQERDVKTIIKIVKYRCKDTWRQNSLAKMIAKIFGLIQGNGKWVWKNRSTHFTVRCKKEWNSGVEIWIFEMERIRGGGGKVEKGTCLFLRWTFRCVYNTITDYTITINKHLLVFINMAPCFDQILVTSRPVLDMN